MEVFSADNKSPGQRTPTSLTRALFALLYPEDGKSCGQVPHLFLVTPTQAQIHFRAQRLTRQSRFVTIALRVNGTKGDTQQGGAMSKPWQEKGPASLPGLAYASWLGPTTTARETSYGRQGSPPKVVDEN